MYEITFDRKQNFPQKTPVFFQNFTYSIMDHADNALELWRNLGLQAAHVVAHDMGDSVLAEILTRKVKNQLPIYFKDFFKVKMPLATFPIYNHPTSHTVLYFVNVLIKK